MCAELDLADLKTKTKEKTHQDKTHATSIPSRTSFMNCVLLAWGYMPVIPALRRQRHEHGEFKASLGYTVRSCLKKKKLCAKSRGRQS
jgi:hypothetical protein